MEQEERSQAAPWPKPCPLTSKGDFVFELKKNVGRLQRQVLIMFNCLRNIFGGRHLAANESLVRLGTVSPVGFLLSPGFIQCATGEHESLLLLGGRTQPIELRMTFLHDYTKELTTSELECEALIRIRPQAEVFRFGSNFAVAEASEAQEARGRVLHLHHTISIKGLICTATLEILKEQTPSASITQFRDALPAIFASLQPFVP